MKKTLRFGSVCSGIEAASLAWKSWVPVFYSEIDKFPSAVLDHHSPGVQNLGDMTKFKNWSDYETDVIVGGTPCQSFSVAGLRKGLDDPRGNLMLTYLAIVNRYRPRWVVWENVPGVLSSNKGRDFGTFIGALGELGYGFAYRVLNAQYFRVPQRRRRVFVVGCLGSWQCAAAVLFEQHSLSWDSKKSEKKRKKIAPTVTSGPPFSRTGNQRVECDALVYGIDEECNATLNGFGPLLKGGQGGPRQAVAYSSTGAGYWKKGCGSLRGRSQDSHENVVAFTQNDAGRDASKNLAPTLRSGGDGGLPLQCVAFAQNTRDEVREMEVAGALAAHPGMKQQSYLRQNMQVRRLTPIECERLQGFPDNYTRIPWINKPAEFCPDGPRYKALGNSMAVPVMRWIGERIEMVDEIS